MLDKKFGSPTITNDGVTIAREIELEDPYEALKQMCIRDRLQIEAQFLAGHIEIL